MLASDADTSPLLKLEEGSISTTGKTTSTYSSSFQDEDVSSEDEHHSTNLIDDETKDNGIGRWGAIAMVINLYVDRGSNTSSFNCTWRVVFSRPCHDCRSPRMCYGSTNRRWLWTDKQSDILCICICCRRGSSREVYACYIDFLLRLIKYLPLADHHGHSTFNV